MFLYNNNAVFWSRIKIISQLTVAPLLYALIMLLVFDPQIYATNYCHTISLNRCLVYKFELEFLFPRWIPCDISMHFSNFLPHIANSYFAPHWTPPPTVQVLSGCHPSTYLLFVCMPKPMRHAFVGRSIRPPVQQSIRAWSTGSPPDLRKQVLPKIWYSSKVCQPISTCN